VEQPELLFESQMEWEKWLEKNHDESEGVWLKFAKKNSSQKSVNYAEALDVALCYGWIDSQTKSLNEKFYLQKFTPRRSRSVWSKINVAKIESLIAEGKMRPAGLAQVESAKADGRWDAAYHSPTNAVVPEDFAKALAKNKKAAQFYEELSKSNKYAILWRLQQAKRPETRARNIVKFIGMLERGEKFH
jgi:uncharacterized protein YdeI (YjbR/CyaY-like superfamily)